MSDFGEVEFGQAIGYAPFVAAFLDPVAQADHSIVAASGELRLHFDAKLCAAGFELGLQAAALGGGQGGSGHDGSFVR